MGGIAINQLNTDSIIRKNEIKFSRNGAEEWAIGSYYDPHRLAKNSFFIWNNILHETAFFISENGMTGISTSWQCAKLNVNGSFKASQIHNPYSKQRINKLPYKKMKIIIIKQQNSINRQFKTAARTLPSPRYSPKSQLPNKASLTVICLLKNIKSRYIS